MTDLSHVDESSGDVKMVDVGHKPVSRRKAVARATVLMAPETSRRIHELPKGDALTTAQLAGIMAAKQTSNLIPLCHPLPLSVVDVELDGRRRPRGHRRLGADDGARRASRWRRLPPRASRR